MQKKFLALFILAILLHPGTFAARHRSHRNHRTHRSHHHTHNKPKQTTPEVTLSYVETLEHPWGIDISHYQTDIDWIKLGQQKPNFIFLKATEGATIQDQKYEEYYHQIGKLNIPVGSYHFFSYKTPGEDQAKNFLATVKRKQGDLPLVLDAEYTRSMPGADTVKKELLTFINLIYQAMGSYPMIYCNYKYYQAYLKEILPENCKLWIVDYQGKPNCDWTFWQTTNRFRHEAIKGHVDLNLFNGTKSNLQSLLF